MRYWTRRVIEMSDLIKALQIFCKYKDELRPTHCSRDLLEIMGIALKDVSKEDREELRSRGVRKTRLYLARGARMLWIL
jgi:hypothetical protein